MSKRKAAAAKTGTRTTRTKASPAVKTMKTAKTAKTKDVPTLDIVDEPPVDIPSPKDEPKESYRMVAKRIWYCRQYREGCQGLAPFLNWEQLMNQPSCPNCGGSMRWRWWGEKQNVESVLSKRPARKTAKSSRV